MISWEEEGGRDVLVCPHRRNKTRGLKQTRPNSEPDRVRVPSLYLSDELDNKFPGVSAFLCLPPQHVFSSDTSYRCQSAPVFQEIWQKAADKKIRGKPDIGINSNVLLQCFAVDFEAV